MRYIIPPIILKKKRLSLPHIIPNPEAIATGDRVAFITFGRQPRTLCGIVISANIKTKRGRRRHRVLTSGKIYLAHPNAIRRLGAKHPHTRPQL